MRCTERMETTNIPSIRVEPDLGTEVEAVLPMARRSPSSSKPRCEPVSNVALFEIEDDVNVAVLAVRNQLEDDCH